MAVFSSCNEAVPSGHEHNFSGGWISDGSSHWKVCEGQDCQVRSGFSAHSFEENNDDPNNPVIICSTCGYIKKLEDHTHTYDRKFYSDSEHHWRRCTKMGCAEKKDIVAHVFGNPDVIQEPKRILKTDRCVDCGYSTVSVYDISSVIKDAGAWNVAFKTLDLSNYSARVIKRNSDNSVYNENSVAIADDGAYYCDSGKAEYYTVKNGKGFTTYQRSEYALNPTAPFVKLDNGSDSYYKTAMNNTYMHVSFENNFELFEYDLEKGEYVCNDDISATIYNADGTVSTRKIYCYDITVRMVDGKINYISMKYYFEEEGKDLYTRILTYYNIGMTNVKVPVEVVENSVLPLK